MKQCSFCSSPVADRSRFCSSCGKPLPGGPEAGLPDTSAPTLPASVSTSSPGSLELGRFLPGTVLVDRYRVVGLLGRGGMGEVYRADDLKLGQTVALKFLPEELTRKPGTLDRFLGEVRIARQVSHPNVCRVYDIGEVNAQHYFTMEYVDGENLESLLRRIGRLPQDKAVQIARQLCAGVAAAHDVGVLHRDLKPSNIMIDGRGRVRITDFGLAGLAEEIRNEDVRSGTPAYMAPEQLQGREVTVRSDLYSLGLVLYELFTGKPAFKAASPTELVQMQTESDPVSPARLVEGLDPAVDRILLRCLSPDPSLRPASARAVAAALPGGDPLAAALEAGETPSPDMVAAAGSEASLSPLAGSLALCLTLLGLTLFPLFAPRVNLTGRVPLDKPPQVLAEKAREVFSTLGYSSGDSSRAQGFDMHQEYLDRIDREDHSIARWERLSRARPAVISFWYRESPRTLVPKDTAGDVSASDPPPTAVPGMRLAKLDLQGRLLELLVAPQKAGPKGSEATDWNPMFQAAGLNAGAFTAAAPEQVPPVYCDQRAAWVGTLPEDPGTKVRLEAGAVGGRVNWMRIVFAGEAAGNPGQPQKARAITVAVTVLILTLLVGAVLLAVRNLRMGRGDRRGAFRVAAALLLTFLVFWILATNHVPTTDEIKRFLISLGFALFFSSVIWLLYLALEPYVRRRWPQMLISWSRLLAGRPRDPMVGRDVLAGLLAGTVAAIVQIGRPLLISRLGLTPPIPMVFPLLDLHGIGATTGLIANFISVATGDAMLFTFFLVLLRILLRRQWAAMAGFLLILTGISFLSREYVWFGVAANAICFTLELLVLVRFGLLTLAAYFFAYTLLLNTPPTSDLSAWYAPSMLLSLGVVAGLAAVAFSISLGGRKLLTAEFLGD